MIKMNYEAPPPSYNQGMDQPAVTIAGPTGYVPQTQPQYQYQQQNQSQLPPIIIQNPPNNWFGYKGVGPIGGVPMKSIYTSQITWAIINMIFFFPLFFLWIPALVFSIQSRSSFNMQEYQVARKKANTAMPFNLLCTIFGDFFF